MCDFTSASWVQSFDRAAVYEEFLRLTNNGTQLQNFTLDRNSVLVDGEGQSGRLALQPGLSVFLRGSWGMNTDRLGRDEEFLEC